MSIEACKACGGLVDGDYIDNLYEYGVPMCSSCIKEFEESVYSRVFGVESDR